MRRGYMIYVRFMYIKRARERERGKESRYKIAVMCSVSYALVVVCFVSCCSVLQCVAVCPNV